VVDNFSLLISHALMLLAAARLLFMPALDHEPSAREEDNPTMRIGKARPDA
jgi:hypothetical protein